MSEKALETYARLKKDKKRGVATYVMLAVTLVFLGMAVIGLVNRQETFLVAGSCFAMVMGLVLICRFFIVWGNFACLKKCVKTLDAANSLGYINEIFTKDYMTDGKICFSAHYMYIPGSRIFAYEDMVNVSIAPNCVQLGIDTIDGQKHSVTMSHDTMCGLLERNNAVMLNESAAKIRERVRIFKETGKK